MFAAAWLYTGIIAIVLFAVESSRRWEMGVRANGPETETALLCPAVQQTPAPTVRVSPTDANTRMALPGGRILVLQCVEAPTDEINFPTFRLLVFGHAHTHRLGLHPV